MSQMLEKIEKLLAETERFMAAASEEVEAFRIKMMGRKGELNALFEDFKALHGEEKKAVGQKLNALKSKVQEKLESLKEKTQVKEEGSDKNRDLTLPGIPVYSNGSRHPISIVRRDIEKIFTGMGFSVSEGREIEDGWHNFTALNTPEDHPARDMQDTFYIQQNPEVVLRTQTSSVQVHIMQHQKPPIRTISPGRVYRREAISARAHCQFHQVEGLYIDESVSFAGLKQVLLSFARQMFGADTKIRLRPSYFPFTEPSAEMDVSCTICGGEGCSICKHSGWVEILGCGMVDPQVLSNCGIDNNKYKGFAFGLGIERVAMIRYRIDDVRLFFENDIRFLKQFV